MFKLHLTKLMMSFSPWTSGSTLHTAWRKARDRDVWHQVVSTATLHWRSSQSRRRRNFLTYLFTYWLTVLTYLYGLNVIEPRRRRPINISPEGATSFVVSARMYSPNMIGTDGGTRMIGVVHKTNKRIRSYDSLLDTTRNDNSYTNAQSRNTRFPVTSP